MEKTFVSSAAKWTGCEAGSDLQPLHLHRQHALDRPVQAHWSAPAGRRRRACPRARACHGISWPGARSRSPSNRGWHRAKRRRNRACRRRGGRRPRPSSGTSFFRFPLESHCRRCHTDGTCHPDWPTSATAGKHSAKSYGPLQGYAIPVRSVCRQGGKLGLQFRQLRHLLGAPRVAEENTVVLECSPDVADDYDSAVFGVGLACAWHALPSKTITQGSPLLKSNSLNFLCPIK